MTKDRRHLLALDQRLSFLAEELTEQNVRLRFLLDFFKVNVQAKTAMLGPDGKPVQQAITLYEFYLLQGRAHMLRQLAEEYAHEAELQRSGETTGDADPQDADAATPEAPASRRVN